ncbi:PQQ-binding-like beta-propeller repeat protein [Halosegnis marinus]|uniref:PQQ-binding-like beta-propeller repeat protein n=1 Tax=Halosegnis marinus TaxID=3034023 RepID=A0ABD5ZSS2_9EURY|nr:PQQ-binding-like beta-propeller repeat protein [Halosegnis sp. DT85]
MAWRADTPPKRTRFSDTPSFAYSDGTVFVHQYGVVEARDPASGALRWRVEDGPDAFGRLVVGAEAVVHRSDDTVRGYAPGDGNRRWSFAADAPVTLHPTGDRTCAYVDADDPVLVGLGGASGERWRVPVPGTVTEVLGRRGDTLYAAVADGPVVAVDTAAGSVEARIGDGTEYAVLVGDTVVVATLDGHVAGYRAATGERRWERESGARPWTTDGALVLDGGTALRRLDPATGNTVWRHDHADGRGHRVVAADDGALLAVRDGRLAEFGTDGRRRWVAPPLPGYFFDASFADGTLFVQGDGVTAAIDRSDGSLSWLFRLASGRREAEPFPFAVGPERVYAGDGERVVAIARDGPPAPAAGTPTPDTDEAVTFDATASSFDGAARYGWLVDSAPRRTDEFEATGRDFDRAFGEAGPHRVALAMVDADAPSARRGPTMVSFVGIEARAPSGTRSATPTPTPDVTTRVADGTPDATSTRTAGAATPTDGPDATATPTGSDTPPSATETGSPTGSATDTRSGTGTDEAPTAAPGQPGFGVAAFVAAGALGLARTVRRFGGR